MKKRRVLKGWVENVLLIIEVVLFMMLGMETPGLVNFIISKALILGVFLSIGYLLVNYTNLAKED